METPEARREAIAASSKPACLLVDFVGNSGKHKLMSAADILGGRVSEEAAAKAVENAKKSGQAVRMDAALTEEEQKLKDAIEASKKKAEHRKVRLVAVSLPINPSSVSPRFVSTT